MLLSVAVSCLTDMRPIQTSADLARYDSMRHIQGKYQQFQRAYFLTSRKQSMDVAESPKCLKTFFHRHTSC